MTMDHAAAVDPGRSLSTDICVIGTGAAGITIARQLNGSGLGVVLLEAGGLRYDRDTEASAFAIDELGLPLSNPEPTRGRWFGGSTNLWFGRVARPAPIDFEQRPWVPNSGWPLRYEEIEAWLPTAATVLDVPHFERISIDAWEPNATVATFHNAGDTCVEPFLWADGKHMGIRHRKLFRNSADIRVLLDATATRFVPYESGVAIDHLVVDNGAGSTFKVSARAFVLAAGGLENPRLLLASTALSERGVGNEHDLVGRYYMDHARGEGLATVDLAGLNDGQIDRLVLLGERVATSSGPAQLRVTFSEQKQRGDQLLNHALYVHMVSTEHQSPAFTAAKRLVGGRSSRQAGVLPDLAEALKGSPALARLVLKKALRLLRPDTAIVVDQLEQVPDPDSRITVDRRRLDRFGMPRVRLDWRIGEATYVSQRRMHETVFSVLAHHGITTMRSRLLDDPDFKPQLADMKHPSGTTRMSASASAGVVDRDCRVHGVDNLYVAGSSVFPTVGNANPTLLIVALAARLAHHLGKRYPAGAR